MTGSDCTVGLPACGTEHSSVSRARVTVRTQKDDRPGTGREQRDPETGRGAVLDSGAASDVVTRVGFFLISHEACEVLGDRGVGEEGPNGDAQRRAGAVSREGSGRVPPPPQEACYWTDGGRADGQAPVSRRLISSPSGVSCRWDPVNPLPGAFPAASWAQPSGPIDLLSLSLPVTTVTMA